MKQKHKPVFIIILLQIIMLTLFIFSCKDSSNPVSHLDDVVFPDSNISYNRHVQPLFNIGCATADCHEQYTKKGNLDLSSYSGFRSSTPGVVIPKDTSLSRMVWSIEGRPGSPIMPPYRSLNMNQVKGIKRWIMEGATDTIP
jgi:hypothetical protein